jgi:hypothetical protein
MALPAIARAQPNASAHREHSDWADREGRLAVTDGDIGAVVFWGLLAVALVMWLQVFKR